MAPTKPSKHMPEMEVDELAEFLRSTYPENVIEDFLAAEIDGSLFLQLCREDLLELLPGAVNLKHRKSIADLIELKRKEEPRAASSVKKAVSPLAPADEIQWSPAPHLHNLDFPIYTDSDLVMSLKTKEITNIAVTRCVQATISTMRSITLSMAEPREPSSTEIMMMAKTLVTRYPCLRDYGDINASKPWLALMTKLKRRLANLKPIAKKQGPCPQRSAVVRKRLRLETVVNESPLQHIQDTEAAASLPTPMPERSSADMDGNDGPPFEGCTKEFVPAADCYPPMESSDNEFGDDENHTSSESTSAAEGLLVSEKIMARHYDKLVKHLKENVKPNHKIVSQLLDLEYVARRRFVEALPESGRIHKVLEAYQCFNNAIHLIEEIRREVDKDNKDYPAQCRERMKEHVDLLYNYAVSLGILKIKARQSDDDKALQVVIALPDLFQSTKRKGRLIMDIPDGIDINKEVANHVQPIILRTPKSLLIVADRNCFSALLSSSICNALLVYMGVFYTFNMKYPLGLDTTLSFLQTHILKDHIHVQDMTKHYKSCVLKFKQFVG